LQPVLAANADTFYPGLRAVVQTFLISFPSFYLVEHGFSAVTNLLTKKNNGSRNQSWRLKNDSHKNRTKLQQIISNASGASNLLG